MGLDELQGRLGASIRCRRSRRQPWGAGGPAAVGRGGADPGQPAAAVGRSRGGGGGKALRQRRQRQLDEAATPASVGQRRTAAAARTACARTPIGASVGSRRRGGSHSPRPVSGATERRDMSIAAIFVRGGAQAVFVLGSRSVGSTSHQREKPTSSKVRQKA